MYHLGEAPPRVPLEPHRPAPKPTMGVPLTFIEYQALIRERNLKTYYAIMRQFLWKNLGASSFLILLISFYYWIMVMEGGHTNREFFGFLFVLLFFFSVLMGAAFNFNPLTMHDSQMLVTAPFERIFTMHNRLLSFGLITFISGLGCILSWDMTESIPFAVSYSLIMVFMVGLGLQFAFHFEKRRLKEAPFWFRFWRHLGAWILTMGLMVLLTYLLYYVFIGGVWEIWQQALFVCALSLPIGFLSYHTWGLPWHLHDEFFVNQYVAKYRFPELEKSRRKDNFWSRLNYRWHTHWQLKEGEGIEAVKAARLLLGQRSGIDVMFIVVGALLCFFTYLIDFWFMVLVLGYLLYYDYLCRDISLGPIINLHILKELPITNRDFVNGIYYRRLLKGVLYFLPFLILHHFIAIERYGWDAEELLVVSSLMFIPQVVFTFYWIYLNLLPSGPFGYAMSLLIIGGNIALFFLCFILVDSFAYNSDHFVMEAIYDMGILNLYWFMILPNLPLLYYTYQKTPELWRDFEGWQFQQLAYSRMYGSN